ncbi:hypothetical protein [Corynebacterium aurimucosum]|uniref:hypothetical protein n=1 Tax=Corynebacterium aurimucosum TaxID=169292 RepID=UPI00187A4D7A|nr:hypothetical protein [Corynebacterium aurimucosum]MBE7340232.1 hypothetical protein [Corynebacterium aurimucosum]
MPRSDIGLLYESFDIPTGVWVISDESYVGRSEHSPYGWMHQQICKLAVYRTKFADSYYLIDSDSYFVSDLSTSDFVDGQGQPRIVASPLSTRYSSNNPLLHKYLTDESVVENAKPFPELERETFLRNLSKARADHKANPSLIAGDRRKYIGEVFAKDGIYNSPLNWGPNPIFHSEILFSMAIDIKEVGMNWRDLIYLAPWEYEWYAYFAMQRFSGTVVPSVSSCIHFAKDSDVEFAKEEGVSTDTLARRFKSVAMASRHFDLEKF